MVERGIGVDHSTIHRWVVRFSPLPPWSASTGASARSPASGMSTRHQGAWRMDVSLPRHRQHGRHGRILFHEHRDLPAAKRLFRKALERYARPDRVVIDGSRTNQEAIVSCDTTNQLQDRCRCRLKPIRTRQSQYLNNRIEQDHRRIKRRVRPMLGFKSPQPPASSSSASKWFTRCAGNRRGLPSILIRHWPSSSTSLLPHSTARHLNCFGSTKICNRTHQRPRWHGRGNHRSH